MAIAKQDQPRGGGGGGAIRHRGQGSCPPPRSFIYAERPRPRSDARDSGESAACFEKSERPCARRVSRRCSPSIRECQVRGILIRRGTCLYLSTLAASRDGPAANAGGGPWSASREAGKRWQSAAHPGPTARGQGNAGALWRSSPGARLAPPLDGPRRPGRRQGSQGGPSSSGAWAA